MASHELFNHAPLGGRASHPQVLSDGKGLVSRGRARSQYVGPLVQQAVMEIADRPEGANEIGARWLRLAGTARDRGGERSRIVVQHREESRPHADQATEEGTVHHIRGQRRTRETPAVQGSCRRQVRVANPHGLHLRAASHFVQLARQFQADVRVHSSGGDADGKSVLDLTMLAADCGVLLELEVSGIDAQEAATALCELIEQGFHEEESGGDASPLDDRVTKYAFSLRRGRIDSGRENAARDA